MFVNFEDFSSSLLCKCFLLEGLKPSFDEKHDEETKITIFVTL